MRLIDADAKELGQRININFGAVTRFIVKSILKDAPTIDAVPVIRCKDCKYFTDYTVCLLHSDNSLPFGHEVTMRPTSFCSYAERW